MCSENNDRLRFVPPPLGCHKFPTYLSRLDCVRGGYPMSHICYILDCGLGWESGREGHLLDVSLALKQE